MMLDASLKAKVMRITVYYLRKGKDYSKNPGTRQCDINPSSSPD